MHSLKSNLVPENQHAVRRITQNCWLIERAAKTMPFASQQHSCTLQITQGSDKQISSKHEVLNTENNLNNVCGPVVGFSNSIDKFSHWIRLKIVLSAMASHEDCHFKYQNLR